MTSAKVEFASPELEAGQTVEVVVLHESNAKGRSIMEILNSGPEPPPVPDGRRGKGVLGAREGVVGPLDLDYTRHALHAMEERMIPKDWVETVVTEPAYADLGP